MRHYRILEKKDDIKRYEIQFLKKVFLGLYYWKDINKQFVYEKYEDALTSVKALVKQEDYNTPHFGYHYIDAYKLFKYKFVGKK